MTTREIAHRRLEAALPAYQTGTADMLVALATITEHGRGSNHFNKYSEADEAWDLQNRLRQIESRLLELVGSLRRREGGQE